MSALTDNCKVSSDYNSYFKLYACGYNGFRQISSKEIDFINDPEEISTTYSTKEQKIVKVECCLSSSYILWDDGKVSVNGWIPGTTKQGNNNNLLPGQVIKDIACVDDHIMLVNKEQKLLSWNDSMHQDSHVVEVVSDLRISQVCCGDLHCVVTTTDGTVGKLKQESNELLLKINKNVFSHQVQSIGCGKEHILLLTMSGKVFSFGGGSRGQLGNGTLEGHSDPLLVEALDGIQISQIACGGWHSAVRSICGDVYCWGWNKDGQVGISNDDVQVQAEPRPLIFDNNDDVTVIDVSCGARHTAAITTCNDVWTWGWGFYGQLGRVSKDECRKPTKIPSICGTRVWCRHWNTFLLVKQVQTRKTSYDVSI